MLHVNHYAFNVFLGHTFSHLLTRLSCRAVPLSQAVPVHSNNSYHLKYNGKGAKRSETPARYYVAHHE
jgi:hypothetical protein